MESVKVSDEVVVRLSKAERDVVMDVLEVEQQGLDLDQNKNKDAHKYGKVIEILLGKLQSA